MPTTTATDVDWLPRFAQVRELDDPASWSLCGVLVRMSVVLSVNKGGQSR